MNKENLICSEQTPEKQRCEDGRRYEYFYPRSPEPSKIEKSSKGETFPVLPQSPEPEKVNCSSSLIGGAYNIKNTFIHFETPKKVNLARSPPKSVPHDFAPSVRGTMQQFPQVQPMPSADGGGGPAADGNMQTLRLSDFLPSPYVQKRQQQMVNAPWPIMENPENGAFPPVPPLPNSSGSPTFLVFDPSAMGFGGDGSPFAGQMWQPDGFTMGAFGMGEDMGMDWPQPAPVMGNTPDMSNVGSSNGANNSMTSNCMNTTGTTDNNMSSNGMSNTMMSKNGSNSNMNINESAQQSIFDVLSAAAPNSKISIQSSSSHSPNKSDSGGYDRRTQSHGSSGHRHQGMSGSHGSSHDRPNGHSNSPNKWRKNRGNHGRH